MTLAINDQPSQVPGSFSPAWVRGTLILVVLAAHAFAFLRLSAPVQITPLPAVAIDYVPLPEAVAAAPPAEQPPTEQSPSEIQSDPPPPDMEPVQPETPPDVVPPPPPFVDEIPPPIPPPTPPPPRQTQPPRPVADVPKKVVPHVAPRPVVSHPATPVPGAIRSAAAAPAAPTMSTASYASLVAAELNRHKSYPDSARASGVSGAVGVAFTIGPSGHATAISITSSSGNGTLDSAARQAVASIHVPPPPGGLFRTATTIRYSLR